MSNRIVDAKKELDEAGKEEENGCVQEERHRLNGLRQSEVFDSFEHVRPNTCLLAGCISMLRIIQISSGPLLHQRCEERAGQAENQTEEPHHVDPDNKSWRFEWRIVWQCDRYSCGFGGDVDELGEQRNRRSVGIGRELGEAYGDESRDNGREKTGLQYFYSDMEQIWNKVSELTKTRTPCVSSVQFLVNFTSSFLDAVR